MAVRSHVLRRGRRALPLALAALVVLALAACGGGSSGQGSQSKTPQPVTVAVSQAKTFAYLPADFGIKLGVWKKRGLEVKNVAVNGGGPTEQTLATGHADIAAQGGFSAMAGILKGDGDRLISGVAPSFKDVVLLVPDNSPIRSVSDLRGQTIGVTSKGSITDFAVERLVKAQGWPAGAVKTATVGGLSQQLAALQSGSTAAFVWTIEGAAQLQVEHKGHILLNFSSVIPHNVFEGLETRSQLIKSNPGMIRSYLEGWYETVRYMKANPQPTIQFMAQNFQFSPEVAGQVYNQSMGNLSLDGSISAADLDGLAQSTVDSGMASKKPAGKDFYDGRFVPVNGGS